MIAILLCAGFAARMYPITKDFPKSLLQVAGRPVLDYLVDQITELPQIRAIHVVTNARFFDHFDQWRLKWESDIKQRGITLHLYNDGATSNDNRLGAVADLAFVLNSLEAPSPALVAAGDNIFRFSLKPIWQKFLQDKKNYLLALPETDRQKLGRTGVLEVGPDDRALKLHEKPSDPPSFWTCPAFYLLQPSALLKVNEYLSRSNAEDAPGHLIAYLITQEPVYAIKVEGKRLDIGSIESHEEANAILLRESVILGDVE